ncbi:hypothetical protein HYY69_00010 [Candidatus Woesearchaeota archaeon]|nr:hypothetical protein [Candidatus Woesearchaeota archaeon]
MVNASYTDQDSDSGTIYFELFVNDVSQLIQSATVAHNRSNVSTFSPNNYAQGNKLIVQVHGQDSASLNGTKVNTSQLTVEAAPSNPPTGSPESGEPGTTPVEPPPECEPEWECGDITKAACIDGKQTVECTDGCGNTKTQSQACQEFCEDSDNGQELTVQGTANGLNPRTKVPFSGTDNCWETGRILEYYCRDNKLTWNTFDCPQGTTCKEGACVAFVPVEPICEDSDVTDKIYDPALPLSNYKYFNPLEKGSVTTVSADGTEKSFDDACRRERLTEFYCDGAKQATKSYICPQGTTCIEGACSGTTCEPVYDPACETDFTEIACVNSLQTKECPDISECNGPSKLVTQPCGCTPQYDPACETDFAGVECKDGQKTKSCPDISACQGPAKQLTQYCGCVPDFGDCPNWNEASCNKNKLKITCQDLHGCVEPVKYQKSCSVLEEEFVTEIPPEELEGEYVNGSFVPYYGVKLETVSQDGELIATNNKLVKDFVINENTSSNIEVKVTNTGIKPLSDLKIVFDVPQDSASFITSPAALSSLQPKKTGSFKTTMHIGNIKKSFPVKLNIFTKETYVLYKFYGVVDKIWKYVDKDVVKRLFKRLLPAVFETIPVPVWWLLFFTLPLLLLLQNTHIIDESTFISLTVTRHIDQFGKLYVHSPAYRRYSRMNNVKPLLVKSADEREVRELQKMYKLDEELSELIIASKRKYRPRIITSVSIPPQLKHKYFMLGFVNPLHAFPLYLIQTYIKKARFNGYRDAEIREELLKKGWSLREVDSCLGLAHGTEHEQVYSYIKEHLAKGFTLHDIRTKLVAHGWATNVVKQCLQQRIVPLEPKLNKLSVLDHDGVKKIHDYILHFDLKSLIHQEVQRGVPHEKIFIHLQKVGWHPEIIAQQLKVPITKSKLTHGLELLSDYVSQEVNQGFELDDIKHRLIHKGWRVDILHKLFTERHITASSIVSNYIDRELLDGFTIDEIRVKLLNRGWKHVLIDQIFIEKLVQPTNLILSYVDREMLAGFDTLAIKNKLLRTNWKKELVDTCLHYAIKQPYNIILYYINHTLEQGYSIDDVRAKLLDKGWNKIVVDSCLKLRIDDASSKLLRYIAMELRLGVDIIKIRSSLLKAGWNMRVVDAFIEQRTLQASSLLVTYIDAELKSGYALSAVKQKLLQRGWHQAIVNKCIDVVTKKPRNLVDAYVQRLTQQGHDLITVKKKLLEKGWEKSFVSEVLDPKIRKGHAVILEYVGTMLKKGFVLEQIKQQLYEKGWRKEVVEDALYRELLRYYHVIDGYVAQQLASGQDLGLIREQLLEVGWKEELVNLVFEERFSKKIEEVLKYARGMQQAGLSIDEIRARLSHKGWKQEIIDTLMKKL